MKHATPQGEFTMTVFSTVTDAIDYFIDSKLANDPNARKLIRKWVLQHVERGALTIILS